MWFAVEMSREVMVFVEVGEKVQSLEVEEEEVD
jgi:hypothetical protein